MKANSNTYKTLLVMVTGSLVFYYFFRLDVLVYISLGIGILAIISSRIAAGIEWLWLKLAQGLGWINSRILLSVVYFLFLFPLALLRRIFQKETNWKLNKDKSSFYVERNHTYTKEDLINPW